MLNNYQHFGRIVPPLSGSGSPERHGSLIECQEKWDVMSCSCVDKYVLHLKTKAGGSSEIFVPICHVLQGNTSQKIVMLALSHG